MSYQQSQSSFYIPRMGIDVTEDDVKYAFTYNNNYIGEVARVDFTPINKQPGFYEDLSGTAKSAFVHMTTVYSNPLTDAIRRKFSEKKAFKFILPNCNNCAYWLLLNNNHPVQPTMMNVNQIAENSRFLQSKIEEQNETIRRLENKLEALTKMVYMLIGDDAKSESTHSSMPDLVNIVSDEDDSLPDLVSVSSDENGSVSSVSSRIRNSIDLCGNN
jgi:hypothetical protein